MNAYSATRYAREILRTSSADKVVIDRDQLRALVIAAEKSPRVARERCISEKLKLKGSP